MTDLYLIAHKVRGKPAFDVASHQTCVFCQTYISVTGVLCEATRPQAECHECDGLGYWWQIPTSGHRAYPWWSIAIYKQNDNKFYINGDFDTVDLNIGPMPPDLPDHYQHSASPSTPKIDLLSALGLNKPAPVAQAAPIHRRF